MLVGVEWLSSLPHSRSPKHFQSILHHKKAELRILMQQGVVVSRRKFKKILFEIYVGR